MALVCATGMNEIDKYSGLNIFILPKYPQSTRKHEL